MTYLRSALLALLVGLLAAPVAARADGVDDIEFVQETLENGLRVVYAPLRQAPVVHVRLLYHVGSRDERPDRQGFAHLFEHMMFRGSAHVGPEEHMKLIGMVGGSSNAFTSYDRTVYVNTLPSNHLELALWLEADRMASFRVTEEIYDIERKVVFEEYRMRQNQPYGTFWEDFMRLAFHEHSYRWPPIGDMDHLAAAGVDELQAFFNRYYVPNNAVLVIAGDIEVDAAREMVRHHFAWIPRGAEVIRDIPDEPEQTDPRRGDAGYRVPLPRVAVGWRLPEYRADDHDAMSLLSTILGHGRSSRLNRLLVDSEHPLAGSAFSSHMRLVDHGVLVVGATVLAERGPAAAEGDDRVAEAERIVREAIESIRHEGVSEEELEKAKTLHRVWLVRGRDTATAVATQLGDAVLYYGDAGQVNEALARLEAVGVEDIQAVAGRFLDPRRSVALVVRPDPMAALGRADGADDGLPPATADAAAQQDAQPRVIEFPEGWAVEPPIAAQQPAPEFEKGVETEVDGVRVIVMPDHRLPLTHWSITLRRGGHSEPAGREGLAGLTAELLRRGAGELDYAELNEDLESRGISLGISDGGDHTRITGSSTTDHLEHGLLRTREMLLEPHLPPEEFERIREQRLNALKLAMENPSTVAGMELRRAIYGDSPLGRSATPASISSITMEDVRAFHERIYHPAEAIVVLSGDITVERGKELARELLSGWPARELAPVEYDFPAAQRQRRILLVDRPEARQSTVRLGLRAYDLESDDKFAGAVANQILSVGIHSRLGRYVRAERGLAYSVFGYFTPNRQAGMFLGGTDTAIESTADAVEAIIRVIDSVRTAGVLDDEVGRAQLRVAGGMVMGMQTIQQQAGYRVDGILNGYPIDYYDVYPQRIERVTPQEVRGVVDQYVDPDRLTIVVVAPADQVLEQLQGLGEVEVVPMPARRE